MYKRQPIFLFYRYLATGSSFNAISFEFLIGATTARKVVRTTCDEIWKVLKPMYMPEKSTEDWITIADQFFQRTNFPNVIGAVDGKHIRIVKPHDSGSSFFNYKKYFSIVLMAWVDAEYKFVCVDISSYGSSSDSSIFKQSNMGRRLEQNNFNIHGDRLLPNDENGKAMTFVIVCDDAFGLSNRILRPYGKRNLNLQKRIYNYRHTRVRRLVECTSES